MELDRLTIKSQSALRRTGRRRRDTTSRSNPTTCCTRCSPIPKASSSPCCISSGWCRSSLDEVGEALDSKPKVYAEGVQVGLSPATARLLEGAGREAEQLTDEYISTEHILGSRATALSRGCSPTRA